MTIAVLEQLRAAHAFDPAPRRVDLAAYHVPSRELGAERDLEARLAQTARDHNRVMIVGPSGCGKTSLIEFVFAPDAEGVAPIPVRLSPEPDEVVTSVQRVAEHVIRTIRDQADLSQRGEGRADRRTTKVALHASWMGFGLGGELSRQLEAGSPARTASTAATLEQLEQLLRIIAADGYVPVVIFDDTDRWFSRAQLGPAERFFATVLPEIRELPCSLVVTAHDAYVDDERIVAHMRRNLEERIDIPRLGDRRGLEAVIGSRVTNHVGDLPLDDVIAPDAIAELWDRYTARPEHNLRDMFRGLHVALTEACDDQLPRIPPGLITAGDW